LIALSGGAVSGALLVAASKLQYFPGHVIARNLNMSGLVVARITGSLFMNPGKVDIVSIDQLLLMVLDQEH